MNTGMHGASAVAGNWGAIDKAGLHSTPEVVNDALGPIPRTSMEKNLEPESKLRHTKLRLYGSRAVPYNPGQRAELSSGLSIDLAIAFGKMSLRLTADLCALL